MQGLCVMDFFQIVDNLYLINRHLMVSNVYIVDI